MTATITHPDGSISIAENSTAQFTHAIIQESSAERRRLARLNRVIYQVKAVVGPILFQLYDPEVVVRRDHTQEVSADAGYEASLTGSDLTFVCGPSMLTMVEVMTDAGSEQKRVSVLEAFTITIQAEAQKNVDYAATLTTERDALNLDTAVTDRWAVSSWSISEALAVAGAARLNASAAADAAPGGAPAFTYTVCAVDGALA